MVTFFLFSFVIQYVVIGLFRPLQGGSKDKTVKFHLNAIIIYKNSHNVEYFAHACLTVCEHKTTTRSTSFGFDASTGFGQKTG